MAIKSQNTKLRVSTATAAADTITGITAASPPVVTAVAHGISNGAIVTVASVAGMIEVNDRAFVVANQATDTVELKGIEGAGYTAYSSGGTLTAHTMTDIGEVKSFGGFDGSAPEIDTTHIRSTAKEYLIGLQDFGTVSLGISLVTDAGQAKLRALKATGAIGTFSCELSDGRVCAFRGYVQTFTLDPLTPDSSVTGSVTIRVTGEPAWFA